MIIRLAAILLLKSARLKRMQYLAARRNMDHKHWMHGNNKRCAGHVHSHSNNTSNNSQRSAFPFGQTSVTIATIEHEPALRASALYTFKRKTIKFFPAIKKHLQIYSNLAYEMITTTYSSVYLFFLLLILCRGFSFRNETNGTVK